MPLLEKPSMQSFKAIMPIASVLHGLIITKFELQLIEHTVCNTRRFAFVSRSILCNLIPIASIAIETFSRIIQIVYS